MTSEHRIRVIYIMGAGRSGSTLLGIALGNASGVFFAGELEAWPSRRGVPNGGEPALARFWADVADRLTGVRDFEGLHFRNVFEHPRGAAQRFSRESRRRRRAYLALNEELFKAVSQASDCPTVVDSSHYPLRRWNLRAVDGLEVFTIWLVRDPRSVISSFGTTVQKPKSPRAAVGYLWIVHMLSMAVYSQIPRDKRLFVRYEHFASDPERELTRIARWLDADLSAIDPQGLRPGLVFQGNRVRTSETIRIALPTPSSGKKLAASARLAVSPLVAALGYRRADN